jgi:IS605 OrfB family transposase
MSRRLRSLTAPFVVTPPKGARVRTRLMVDDHDAAVLRAIGVHLGSLAGQDLARRCKEGKRDARQRARSRGERKRDLTARSSSRWAGAITRTSEDAWQLAYRNLLAERRSLSSRVNRIRRRLGLATGTGHGWTRGYATRAERFEKQRRLQVLESRLAEAERRIADGRVSVCRGGTKLARTRHHCEKAGLAEAGWRERWKSARLFMTADGETGKAWGNESIRFHPGEHWVQVKLPAALSHLANRPHGRYQLSCPVDFPYRGDEVAAQAASGAIRYDVSLDTDKGRWYLDASWTFAGDQIMPALGDLRTDPVLAVDLNHGHLACCVVDPSGNPTGEPVTVPIDLAGLPTSTRDGHLRKAITSLTGLALEHRCRAIVIEDLDFVANREQGRERQGNRPNTGRRGKSFRRLVGGLPTAKFRERLVQMATNAGLFVVAVDPAYTSKWGTQHWLAPLKQASPQANGHHAAALVIGRRGLGHRARRRERRDSTRPEDREERAADSAVHDAATPISEPVDQEARERPHPRRKTRAAERNTLGEQAAKTVRAAWE